MSKIDYSFLCGSPYIVTPRHVERHILRNLSFHFSKWNGGTIFEVRNERIYNGNYKETLSTSRIMGFAQSSLGYLDYFRLSWNRLYVLDRWKRLSNTATCEIFK